MANKNEECKYCDHALDSPVHDLTKKLDPPVHRFQPRDEEPADQQRRLAPATEACLNGVVQARRAVYPILELSLRLNSSARPVHEMLISIWQQLDRCTELLEASGKK